MAKEMSSAQMQLYLLLKKKDLEGSSVSINEITEATNWRAETLSNYIGKGFFKDFLSPRSDGNYQVSGLQNLSEKEFHKSITQSRAVREIGHKFKCKTAKALIGKARDNIILALEIYNRPSLSNRVDGFLMLFCAAWEQLLKASIAEMGNEIDIFRKQKEGRIRETLSLRECLEKYYPDSNNLIRKNIESIAFLRDKAAHLVLLELQDVAGRLFQSGVINFADEFREFTGQGFVDAPPIGLLTLVYDSVPTHAVQLEMRYGEESAKELLDITQKLKDEIDGYKDPKFAIPLEYKLVFSKEHADADITLSNIANASDQAVVIEKMVDPTERCPYTTKTAAQKITELLATMLPQQDLEKRLSSRNKTRDYLNDNDFLAICEAESWKKGNNEYHYFLEIANRHIYSQKAVDFASRKITSSEMYLHQARENYKIQIKSKMKSNKILHPTKS